MRVLPVRSICDLQFSLGHVILLLVLNNVCILLGLIHLYATKLLLVIGVHGYKQIVRHVATLVRFSIKYHMLTSCPTSMACSPCCHMLVLDPGVHTKAKCLQEELNFLFQILEEFRKLPSQICADPN